MNNYYGSRRYGFTIVELLIVIVIIGILAAITIIAYTGISQRAIIASLQSDLSNASKQLKLFQVVNSVYPTTLDCSQPDSVTNKCIKFSGGNVIGYTNTDVITDTRTFCLNASRGDLIYNITQDSTLSSGGCPLVGMWTFDGNADDSSGNSRNGTVFGATPSTGQNGSLNGAYSFTAATQRISAPMVNINNTLTLAAWINPVSTPTEHYTILIGVAPNSFYLSMSNDNSLHCHWYSTSPAGYHSSGAGTISLNQWNYVVATWDGMNAKLYVNGQLKNTVPVTGSGLTSTNVYIGAENAARQFYGAIDDVRIYNKALSLSDVQTLFTAGAK